ncbi:hypothetical protein EF847_01480 [Actinobacteria bacterium YIM 96077]|uniref:Uncharacterized protein n=1 Tax=Phytoactinopolyspora halophila TaxID=1981511 RepID=A0A329QKU2_9ACTN|nr:hypothetical protein EF847_01480 [Actinobacteria bacterium YIM 96077]RAW11138.1 hypothetical protein DPM12_17505 [Phytoactinopolyspora halophila]
MGKQDGVDVEVRGGSDPSKVNNWQETMMDVRDAYFSLSSQDQQVLQHGMAVAWDWEKLAIRCSAPGPEAARKVVQRTLEKMREFLGNSAVRIYGEFTGTRNNPECSYDAHAEETARVNDRVFS